MNSVMIGAGIILGLIGVIIIAVLSEWTIGSILIFCSIIAFVFGGGKNYIK